MTTAQVFAEYLGLTEESAPWAYGPRHAHYRDRTQVLTATSPLAPSPTPGWLEALVQASCGLVFFGPTRGDDGCVARMDGGLSADGLSAHPTHAVALALLAADPALRAACEACEDWAQYKETHHD